MSEYEDSIENEQVHDKSLFDVEAARGRCLRLLKMYALLPRTLLQATGKETSISFTAPSSDKLLSLDVPLMASVFTVSHSADLAESLARH